jgi:uncharacterized protein YjgD (DUF1641 family)
MNNEEIILERLDSLESQVAPLAESARAIGELRQDLAPRVNELVKALIVELADVEADFQLEDLLYLTKKAMRNVGNFGIALDQLKNLIDFAMTAEPLLKSTVPQLIFFLDDLEQKGVLRMVSTAVEVLKKVGETYTAEDMEQVGEGVVRLMGIAKKMTTPRTLDLLEKAADLPDKVDLSRAAPVGPLSMLWAMDSEAKQGLGVVLELTKGLAALKA